MITRKAKKRSSFRLLERLEPIDEHWSISIKGRLLITIVGLKASLFPISFSKEFSRILYSYSVLAPSTNE